MDIADSAEELEEFQIDMALKNHAEKRDTTAQVSIGGEVICYDCGLPIPPQRLAALPHAARCVGCQEIFEEERRQWA